jgi:hypothetical protein
MRRITRESLLQRLQEGRKIEARLRGLARQLERISPGEAQGLVTLVQPELTAPLAESDCGLEADDAKT